MQSIKINQRSRWDRERDKIYVVISKKLPSQILKFIGYNKDKKRIYLYIYIYI